VKKEEREMNTNCLEGLRCPNCGNEDELLVRAEMWVSLTDDGTDPFANSTKHRGGVEYDENSDAACPECDYEGALKDFEVKKGKKQ